jgi:hypothetical protein
MAKRKYLSQRQLTVLDDLLNSDLDKQAVMDKHKISRNTYNRWQADELFVDEFNRRITSAHRQSVALIARYAPLAAAKLVQLTESKNQETARKACLDIMSVPKVVGKETKASTDPQSVVDNQAEQLPPRTASKLLAALAEAEEKDNDLKKA